MNVLFTLTFNNFYKMQSQFVEMEQNQLWKPTIVDDGVTSTPKTYRTPPIWKSFYSAAVKKLAIQQKRHEFLESRLDLIHRRKILK